MRSLRMALSLGAACAYLATPRMGSACGGTFCDSGPRFMSVDQKGEDIIFVMEPGKVEAHIRIRYQGDAPHFSWVLPVQALPEVEVGSEALFDRMLRATVPTYGYTTQRDFCGAATGATGTGGAGGGFPGAVVADAGARDGGVSIVVQKTVGAFDVTVLQGGTTQEVLTWLTTNQYQTPPNAGALFDGYVANHFLFVAVKLTSGAGADEIHPLVVRYPGSQPCVPLKLTAIAAVEDMGIRTFFLGTKRVVPKNYKHIVPNVVRLDWMQFGSNYNDLVGRAADSPIANGHAFTTEYAGPTAILGAAPIAQAKWDASAFSTIAVTDVVNRLQQQGFLSCFGSGTTSAVCNYAHPLILPLLREFVPPPATLTLGGEAGVGSIITDPTMIENFFYSCLACYQGQIDASKWSAPAFTSALVSRVIDPARHADALLATWPYLTRMFTTMSPAEMTQDPEFQERDALAEVNVSGSATRRIACTGASGMTLPDGRPVALTPQSTWPGFSSDMPWAERIEEFTASGNPIVLIDNTEQINATLKAWNDSQHWPPAGAGTTGGGAGGAIGATLGAGGNAPSSSTTGGPSSGGAGGIAGEGGKFELAASVAPSGCSCRIGTPSSSRLIPGLAGLLGLLPLRKRRRRP